MQMEYAQAKDPAFQLLIPIRSSQIKDMNQIAAFNDELLSLEKGSNQIEKPRIHHINKIIFENFFVSPISSALVQSVLRHSRQCAAVKLPGAFYLTLFLQISFRSYVN